MSKERNITTLPLDGGALCFDFINTVHAWRGVNLHEYLGDYGSLVQWCAKVGILSTKQRKLLQQHAASHPGEAAKALEKIKQVRAVLYHCFAAVAAGRPQQLSETLLQQFNAAITKGLSHIRFAAKGTTLEQGWSHAPTDLLAPLWIVMKSAYDILAQEDSVRIKECPACGWIFLDQTKNNKRRWCNPVSCGSIEKSKKYYQKKKREMEGA
ncbi:CGNR zinc finger domain-containing protein [Chitinophaga japonensis]|uniref:Putative RNA-binding Zn ribbon-like protein n=1 Tax=Chitinophaga japonensis TaxID=104662 RepID=A0A562T6R1_CHIJA|nr:CGNR zinc finger domain-containing protein [Chitinophaga japonensis]TWI89043.1 putative RNA-binding Zn ribbon-like protein [Chitinophaga japonensis]